MDSLIPIYHQLRVYIIKFINSNGYTTQTYLLTLSTNISTNKQLQQFRIILACISILLLHLILFILGKKEDKNGWFLMSFGRSTHNLCGSTMFLHPSKWAANLSQKKKKWVATNLYEKLRLQQC